LALTSPTSGGRLVDIVRLRTKATEFILFVFLDKMKALVGPQFNTKELNSVKDGYLLHAYDNIWLL
jgi:hypothetical protein